MCTLVMWDSENHIHTLLCVCCLIEISVWSAVSHLQISSFKFNEIHISVSGGGRGGGSCKKIHLAEIVNLMAGEE